jgi:hypothetical protein
MGCQPKPDLTSDLKPTAKGERMPLDMKKIEESLAAAKASRYQRQLERVRADGRRSSKHIELVVQESIENIVAGERSFVIYGEPQSGKTEMMICLTARLLDESFKWVVILLNDSIDLLDQNLTRFQRSSLSPTPTNYTELLDPDFRLKADSFVVFCKKNAKDLRNLLDVIGKAKKIVVIDDEADYASPNTKINQDEQSRINELITLLIGVHGFYIGVTATPARLDLNNTFDNKTTRWIRFAPHESYRGQDIFFPTKRPKDLGFILELLPDTQDTPKHLREALFAFFVSCAEMNLSSEIETNYCFLVHTSGKRADHSDDYRDIRDILAVLSRSSTNDELREKYLIEIYEIAEKRFRSRGQEIAEWIASRSDMSHIVLMNSDSNKKTNDFEKATNPAFVFTIAIGGNIVSRGVTFDNLLGMFFTRDVKHKIQQDTYIQRARMFGNRGQYLRNFQLTVPYSLYQDWRRCFIFHRLSLKSLQAGLGAPIWLEGGRVKPVASGSIDKANVSITHGEMGFAIFPYNSKLEEILDARVPVLERLVELQKEIGVESCPDFMVELIRELSPYGEHSTHFFPTTEIEAYSDADPRSISRKRGGAIRGFTQEEKSGKYANVEHLLKIFTNKTGMARLYYKYSGQLRQVVNRKHADV